MNLFDLTAKLTLDKSDYDNKINEAKNQNQDLLQNTEKTSAKSVVAWAAIAAAVVGVSKAVKDAIIASANYADQIGDTAEKWGFATREIQEFDYWATMNGTTLESLLTGMRGLVNQAEAGSEAFKKLGVSVKDQNGNLKDQKTLFLDTITALQGVSNQTERNALQFEIFGRSGIELGQIINLTANDLNRLSQEAEDLGIILSEDTIGQASTFNDQLDQLRLSFKSVLAGLISGDAEAEANLDKFLENLGERVEEWIPRFIKIAGTLVTKVIEGLIKLLPDILPALIESVMGLTLDFDWVQLGKSILNAVIKGALSILVNNPLMQLLSKIFGFDLSSINEGISNIDIFGDKTKSAINEISSTSNDTKISSDKYEISVEMSSTNYTKEDAKILAEEVIKEIATKKQASGR